MPPGAAVRAGQPLGCLAHKVLLSDITTLERLISRVRYRATLRLWHRLTCALTDTQRQKLTALVASQGATLAWKICALRRGDDRRRSCCDI